MHGFYWFNLRFYHDFLQLYRSHVMYIDSNLRSAISNTSGFLIYVVITVIAVVIKRAFGLFLQGNQCHPCSRVKILLESPESGGSTSVQDHQISIKILNFTNSAGGPDPGAPGCGQFTSRYQGFDESIVVSQA